MRRSRAERGFSVALGLFAVVLALYLFLSSPFFRLENLLLSGNTRYTEVDVISMAGLQMGQNLFDINTKEIEKRLSSDPRIARADVRRFLPAGLKVFVEDRIAVAALATATGLWRIDGEGRVMEEITGPHSHIIISLQPMLGTVKPGDVLDMPAVRAAAAIAAAMPADLAARISEIKASSLENLELVTRDGITVRFGAWRDVDEKARILRLLLTQMQSKGSRAHSIDISVPDNPVVR